MKKCENRFELITENLLALSYDLPLEVVNSWTYSSYYIARYLDEHADNGAGFDVKSSAMMAAGRLDWLLREARLTLGEIFNLADLFTLVNSYRGKIFSPDQIKCIESDLCREFDVELNDYEATSIAPLIDKLRGLSTLQRLALADAVEQFWYRGLRLEKIEPREFFESLAIRLE